MKPLIVKDYREMYTAIKTGKSPEDGKPKHKGNWTIYYGKTPIEYDVPIKAVANKIKTYGMFGRLYPDKSKFHYKPYTSK